MSYLERYRQKLRQQRKKEMDKSDRPRKTIKFLIKPPPQTPGVKPGRIPLPGPKRWPLTSYGRIEED